MAKDKPKISSLDPVWDRIKEDAHAAIAAEPLIGGMVHATILHHGSLESALAYRFAFKLSSSEMTGQLMREISEEAYSEDPSLGEAARADPRRDLRTRPRLPSADAARFSSSRASRPCKHIESDIGCGHTHARTWPYFTPGPRERNLRNRHSPERQDRKGADDRPCPFHRDRRDGSCRRQCLHASFGYAGRHPARRTTIGIQRLATAS